LVHQPHEEIAIVVVILLRVNLELEEDLSALCDQQDIRVVLRLVLFLKNLGQILPLIFIPHIEMPESGIPFRVLLL